MREKTKILGVTFDAVLMEEALQMTEEFFEDGKQHMICTPNPEIVMMAQNDKELFSILHNADMVIPDGIGIVWASKYNEVVIKERVAGYDFTQNLFARLKDTDKKVYFLGGGVGVARQASIKMRDAYEGLEIVGIQNGYFDEEKEKEIIEDIKEKKPDLLLVAMGAPKQEKWIAEHMEELGVPVLIGVGGSFDVMAGVIKRAPVLFQKMKLEWFYRLLTQPSRWKRMLQLPLFVLLVWRRRIG